MSNKHNYKRKKEKIKMDKFWIFANCCLHFVQAPVNQHKKDTLKTCYSGSNMCGDVICNKKQNSALLMACDGTVAHKVR